MRLISVLVYRAGIILLAILLEGAALAQQYTISTIAGGAPPPTPAPATSASIGNPAGIAADAAGNVYFSSSNCVFRIGPDGVLTRIAGKTGTA